MGRLFPKYNAHQYQMDHYFAKIPGYFDKTTEIVDYGFVRLMEMIGKWTPLGEDIHIIKHRVTLRQNFHL